MVDIYNLENGPYFSDIAGNSRTTASVAVGDSYTGTLERYGDRDWIAVNLDAGETYTIDLDGYGSSGVHDTYLRVYAPGSSGPRSGMLVARNDDADYWGGDLSSQVEFTAAQTGTYFIDARSYGGWYTGNYQVTVNGSGGSTAGASDIAATSGTTASVAVGDIFTGTLESSGDSDWVAVELEAGQTYRINLDGTGNDALPDTYLRVFAPGSSDRASGTLVASNDDVNLRGGDYTSMVEFTATQSGTHYIDAGAYADYYTGDYIIAVESLDVAATSATTASVDVDGTYVGTLESSGDSDWVAVELEAGQTYRINLDGTGNDALPDTYLRVFAPGSSDRASGTLVASNDDVNLRGGDYTSMVEFTATQSGTHYIDAGAYADYYTGDYIIAVESVDTAPTAPTTGGVNVAIEEIGNYMASGIWGEPRGFDVGADNAITVNLAGLSGNYTEFAEDALQTWSDIIGVDFVTTSGAAEITFTDNQLGAWSSPVSNGANIVSSTVNIQQNWANEFYTYQTFVHEIGHAIGLDHPGPYNGTATFGISNIFDQDSWQSTVMSYFDQVENTNIDASFAYLVTPMLADIEALEIVYGLGSETRTGNTHYGYNASSDSPYDQTILDSLGQSYSLTLVDNGGIDTIDLSGSVSTNRIDLNGGASSDTGGLTGNLFISSDSVIENAIGGSANDTIIGNTANNTLTGGGGSDRFVFATGGNSDTVNDFQDGLDLLQFNGGLSLNDLTVTNSDIGALVQFGSDSVVLVGVNASQVTNSDFVFA